MTRIITILSSKLLFMPSLIFIIIIMQHYSIDHTIKQNNHFSVGLNLIKKKSLGPWEIDQKSQTFSPLFKPKQKKIQQPKSTQKKLQFHLQKIENEEQQHNLNTHFATGRHRSYKKKLTDKPFKISEKKIQDQKIPNNVEKKLLYPIKQMKQPEKIVMKLQNMWDNRSKTPEIKIHQRKQQSQQIKSRTMFLKPKEHLRKFINLEQIIKKTLNSHNNMSECPSIFFSHTGNFTKRTFLNRLKSPSFQSVSTYL